MRKKQYLKLPKIKLEWEIDPFAGYFSKTPDGRRFLIQRSKTEQQGWNVYEYSENEQRFVPFQQPFFWHLNAAKWAVDKYVTNTGEEQCS